jgi:hypothetical protein
LFDFARELVGSLAAGDHAFDRVAVRWDRAAAMDLTGLCGCYTLLAMVLNTAQVPLPEGAVPFQPCGAPVAMATPAFAAIWSPWRRLRAAPDGSRRS